jgi:hypothetical protein
VFAETTGATFASTEQSPAKHDGWAMVSANFQKKRKKMTNE